MLSPILYYVLLLATCGYAWRCGRQDERIAAAICIGATLATSLVLSPVGQRYDGVETGVMAVDIATFLAFTAIAMRSQRFWPLWMSGLQLTTAFAHVMKAIDIALLPYAYAAAARFWVYPILLILAVATFRERQRDTNSRGMAVA